MLLNVQITYENLLSPLRNVHICVWEQVQGFDCPARCIETTAGFYLPSPLSSSLPPLNPTFVVTNSINTNANHYLCHHLCRRHHSYITIFITTSTIPTLQSLPSPPSSVTGTRTRTRRKGGCGRWQSLFWPQSLKTWEGINHLESIIWEEESIKEWRRRRRGGWWRRQTPLPVPVTLHAKKCWLPQLFG